MPAQRWKNTSITTNAWRHLSWTFEDVPRLAARTAHEDLNGTLFDEERPEETDLILHDDDDDDDDAEDHQSTGTAVAEAVVPSSTVASQVERAERFLFVRCA